MCLMKNLSHCAVMTPVCRDLVTGRETFATKLIGRNRTNRPVDDIKCPDGMAVNSVDATVTTYQSGAYLVEVSIGCAQYSTD